MHDLSCTINSFNPTGKLNHWNQHQPKTTLLLLNDPKSYKVRVAQWWEHSPPFKVARVRILASRAIHVAIRGLSLLLVLSLTPRSFSPWVPVFPSSQKPTLSNSNSIWKTRTRVKGFLRTELLSAPRIGKQMDFPETVSINGEQHFVSVHGFFVLAPQPKL